MAAPPPAHAPVDSDDPAVLALGPCAAAYVELEVRMRRGEGTVGRTETVGLGVKRPTTHLFSFPTQTCLGDHDRDWTKCQAAVKALRNCVASKDQGDKKAVKPPPSSS